MAAAPRFLVLEAPRSTRRDHLALTALLTGWLVYTRLYPILAGAHATLPPCPFYLLTGHPCPFCGGTRSFAAMWRGDVGAAARYYPLGPLLFVLTFGAVAYTAWAAFRGRQLQVAAGGRWLRGGVAVVALALALSWSLKLFWLGN